jgi:TP901 family phage tail tape measure protein
VERTVRTILEAKVDGFKAGIKSAKSEVASFSTHLQKQAKENSQAFATMGGGLAVFGGAVTGFAALSVKKFAEFDQAMSNVEAATREGAGGMNALRQAALDAGASTIFTATESANAIDEMARAGLSTADILAGGLAGGLDLAAAGGLGVAEAAGIMATSLNQFNLKGSQATHVADLLAAGAGKAMGTVSDLGKALEYVGPVANAMGISIDETVGTLAMFANAGLVGEKGGTALRGVLAALTAPSQKSAAEIKKLGLNIYDANGKFLGMQTVAGELQRTLGGLDDKQRNYSLGVIFGNAQLAAATTLMDEGAAGVAKMTAAVQDQGYAAENAQIRMGNLSGDVERLGGAMDTWMINMGSAADGPLRAIVQGLTGLVEAAGNASPEFQTLAFWTTSVVGVMTLFSGLLMIVVPKIVEFRAAAALLSAEFPKIATGIGLVMKAAGLIGLALTAFTALATWAEANKNSLKSTDAEMQNVLVTAKSGKEILASAFGGNDVRKFGEYVKSSSNGLQVFKMYAGDAATGASNLGAVLKSIKEDKDSFFVWDPQNDQWAEGIEDMGEKLGTLAASDLPAAQNAFKLMAKETDGSKAQMLQLLDLMPAYKDQLIDVASAAGIDATEGQNLLNIAMGQGAQGAEVNRSKLEEVAGQAKETEESIETLADELKNFGNVTLDAHAAEREFNQSLIDAKAHFDKMREAGVSNAEMLDLTTENGIKTSAIIDGVASAANEAAGAALAQGAGQDKVNGILDTARGRMMNMMTALGMSEQAAKEYIDQILATPDDVSTTVTLNGVDRARAIIAELTATRVKNIELRMTKMPDLNGPASGTGGMGTYAHGGKVTPQYRASGGRISDMVDWRRIGTDTVPAMLTPGEYIVNPKAAKENEALLDAINSGRLQNGSMGSGISAPPNRSVPAPVFYGGDTNVTVTSKDGVLEKIVDVQIEKADAKNNTTVKNGRSGR